MTLTLIDLTVHSNQQAFDAVARHLSKMTARAVIPNPREEYRLTNPWVCVYETPDGKEHCAIGGLLVLDTPEKHEWARATMGGTDDVAWYEGEGVGVGTYVDFGGIDSDLLAALQSVHDEQYNWNESGFFAWEKMDEIADRYGLSREALDALGV
jgi:hypothetical protein